MQKGMADQDRLRAEMNQRIEALELPELSKQFLRARWLEQVLWFEGKAQYASAWTTRLYLTMIIGGLIVPALVSLNVGDDAAAIVKLLTLLVSLMVGMSAAAEKFFNYGERSRRYRRTADSLKTEGWQFFQLSGAYAGQIYTQAFAAFTARVEELSQEEAEVYVAKVVKDKKREE